MLRKILFYFLILFFTITFLGKNNVYAADACTLVMSSPSPLEVGMQHFNIQVRFDDASKNTKYTSGEYFITIGGSASPIDDGATNQKGANATLFSGFVSTNEEFNLSDGFRWGDRAKLEYGTLNVYVWKKNPEQLICEGSKQVIDVPSEADATPKSCPICPDDSYWNIHANKCLITSNGDSIPSISRVDCSAQGTACAHGLGYCYNPSPRRDCSAYGKLNAACDPAKTNPGDCGNDLVCDTARKKCVKAKSSLGPTCYKCQPQPVSKWNGEYCANVSNTCVAPATRAYCGTGFACTQGKGCLESTDNQETDKPKPNPLSTPCGTSLSGDDSEANTKDGECQSISSALGDIPTNPFDLIPKIISIILGFAGAIVIILIIRAGYKLMFSQGNPEKTQEAREELTSAIVGLLFIVFSFVLLQFILNDLLRIQDLPKGKPIK